MPVNRTAVGVIAALVVVLLAAGIVGEATKKSPPKSFMAGGSFRAVFVPTDRDRTVIVTPCDAPEPKTGEGALTTPGVTTVRLRRDSGLRTVLVPRCTAQKGTQLNGATNLPSAAFVLKPGERPAVAPGKSAAGVQAQVVVPTRSDAATIVVPPCRATSKAAARDEVVLRPGDRPGTAVAPAC
jgi:hypothetical protein